MKAVFSLGIMIFNANISFTFQAVRNLSTHPTYLCFGLFCDFWVYIWVLGLVKFMEIGNMILKI